MSASELDEAAREAAAHGAGGVFAVVFHRPPPPMPVQGWARRALMKQAQVRFTPEQIDFLESNFMQSATGGERMRDKKVRRLMQEDPRFKMKFDPATGQLLVLSQPQIASYFSRRASQVKQAAIKAAIAAAAATEAKPEHEARSAATEAELANTREEAASEKEAKLAHDARADARRRSQPSKPNMAVVLDVSRILSVSQPGAIHVRQRRAGSLCRHD